MSLSLEHLTINQKNMLKSVEGTSIYDSMVAQLTRTSTYSIPTAKKYSQLEDYEGTMYYYQHGGLCNRSYSHTDGNGMIFTKIN